MNLAALRFEQKKVLRLGVQIALSRYQREMKLFLETIRACPECRKFYQDDEGSINIYRNSPWNEAQ